MHEPELDPKALANVQDPFPLYRWLREHDPVHWSESLGGWLITRYEDVLEVFDRPESFSSDRFRKLDPRFASDREPVRAVARVLGDWLVFRDAPDHTRLRGLLQKSFTPRHLEKNREGIQHTIDTLLDSVVERGEMDLDVPVSTYVPSFAPANDSGREITLRELMSHRSGLVL